MYELFKEIITPIVVESTDDHVEEVEEIIDNSQSLMLAAILQVTIPMKNDVVRVTESSVFDSGAVGVITTINANEFTISTDTGVVIAEDVDRLITQTDINDKGLELAFRKIYEDAITKLVVLGGESRLIENELVIECINASLINNPYIEVATDEYSDILAEKLQLRFPRILHGVISSPKNYNLLRGDK